MERLNELNEAVEKVIEVAVKIHEEVYTEINEKAPLVIHQQLCSQLVRIMKENPNKTSKQIPKALDVLAAIKALEELHPKLKDK